jgi:hypothetical protein
MFISFYLWLPFIHRYTNFETEAAGLSASGMAYLPLARFICLGHGLSCLWHGLCALGAFEFIQSVSRDPAPA